MSRPFLLLAAATALALPAAVHAKQKTTPKPKAGDASAKSAADSGKVSQDDAVRLQLFLDHANFGPGKIDGAYGGFTKLAWMKWQGANGVNPPKDTFDPKDPALANVGEPFTQYTITAEDLSSLGPVPAKPEEQAKLKVLPYSTLSEEIGERFHAGADFLVRLNAPKKFDELKAGDTVKVPNVQPPFDLAKVAGVREGQRAKNQESEKAKKERLAKEKKAAAANGNANAEASPAPSATPAETPPPPAAEPVPMLSAAAYIHISTKECLLELRDGDRLVAAFPVTPGSKAIPTPVGTWKIVAKTLMPNFRWDHEMLMHGKRSDTAYELPPGPNNPVGIAWIALNRPGIGMHGTTSPDTIGRSASHGCIRLANWDAFKLYGMVDKGLRVVIE